MKKKRIFYMTITLIIILAALAAGLIAIHPALGRAPRGERLERILHSPNYRDGKFHNLNPTPQIVSDKGFFGTFYDFVFGNHPRRRPKTALPTEKTDLHGLDRGEEALVWFGHSSYFVQTGGIRLLVDPVLTSDFPMSVMFRPFKGTDIYTPDDIPEIDYLIITHDHFDHLDYETVSRLRNRVGRVVCGLGVGEHLERWGYAPERIAEMDWNDSLSADGITFHCLPTRHFSGRGPRPNSTLWASFMVETPSQRIYLAGDGGYDTHFAEIGRRFAPIDLAVMENGQYDPDWRYIHLLPEQLVEAIRDLAPRQVLTVHNSKFSLCKRPWDEPLQKIDSAAQAEGFRLLTPRIGQEVRLKDSTQVFDRWWKNID